ncbi:MAG: polysaccharide biosynthesis protein [Candidatus Sulfobium sp.]
MNGNQSHIYKTIKKYILNYKQLFVALLFLFEAALANYCAFLLRFDSILPGADMNRFLLYLPVLLLFRLTFYFASGLHRGLWRYASISDMIKIVNSATLGSVLYLIFVHYIVGDMHFPRSVYVLDWLLFIIISGMTRLFIRVFREYMLFDPPRKKLLVIGAGDPGEMVVREMKNSHESAYEPVGFVDDDEQKKGLTIHGVPILGNIDALPEIIKKRGVDEILVAVSTDAQKVIRSVYEKCKPFNISIKKLPAINDLLDGNVSVAGKLGQRLVEAGIVTEDQIQEALALQKGEGGRLGSKLVKLGHISEERLIQFLNKQYGIAHMKPISLVDLLQRDPVKTDITSVKTLIEGKTVMVTGAGGSIGSELCRQIVKYNPSSLLLFDRYENSTFSVDNELRATQRKTKIFTIIGDIQDALYLEHTFTNYKPQIIFHAAAYKHVPLMENNPIEAIRNNVFGTKNLIDIASRHCAEAFVLISTDKAVNPTSIMGASKRIAEFLTVKMNACCRTKFTTVRFGNVLGTNGSVVPIFKEQLKNGGPVTVTHPDIRRFFMLIPEAVQLVLVAAASGHGGEIFVLDMGSPVKIVDLAENIIRLSGFIPYQEIKIKFTGLRPGEKLYEDLFDESEQMIPTTHEKLMIAVPDIPSTEDLAVHLAELQNIVGNYAVDDVIRKLRTIVPNFKNGMSGDVTAGETVDLLLH